MLAALEGGAEDVRASSVMWEVIAAPGDLIAVQGSLKEAGISVDNVEVTQLPTTTIDLDESKARQVLRLVDALEDLDDVQTVFGNFDMSDEVLEAVAAD